DWVARAAVTHEAVVESVVASAAVLPMKLFTIFTSDDRAVDHMRRDGRRIDSVLRRVANHHEWGVRIVIHRAPRPAPRRPTRSTRGIGASYLSAKRVERDRAARVAEGARDRAADVYDRIAAHASAARRKTPQELPVQTGPLLLDAALLVPVSRPARFRKAVASQARALARDGYRLTLTGPWPPYSFVQD